MLCSAEEIERKRREAQEKLAQRVVSSPHSNTSRNETQINIPSYLKANSPRFKHTSNLAESKAFNHNQKPRQKPYEKGQKTPALQFYGKSKVVTGKIVLTSEDRFNVEVSGVNPPILDSFRKMPTRHWDPISKIWSFHMKDYEFLVTTMQEIPDFVLERLPSFVVKCLKLPPEKAEIDMNRMDPELYQSLLPFQIEGLSYGLNRSGRCLIADEMGLGKTFQALAIMNYYQDDWPLLIATNASMRHVWEETIFKYLPSVTIMKVQYMTSSRDYINDAQILIVSHDLMTRCSDTLLKRNFGAFIVDESHILKNYKTKVANAAFALAKNAKRLVLLSGTPALSRPSELYTQLQMIDPHFFGSFFEYSKRYCDGKQTPFGWNSTGQSNLKELEIVLHKKFMIRRTKEEVINSLPSMNKEVVNLDVHLERFSEEDRQCLTALGRQYNSEMKASDKRALLLTYFAETSKIKIPSVCSYVLQMLQTNRKFLFFAHHQNMLNAVEEVVKQKNIKYIRIDGNTTIDQRKYFVDKFQLDNSCMVALLSITAANAGITLTAAQLVLFGELHWNPSILAQAEARAHRIGQQGSVLVQYLLGDGTADDSIWPMLQEKQTILTKFGLSENNLADVRFKRQDNPSSYSASDLTNGLNVDRNILNITAAKTMDISMYFRSPEKKCDNTTETNKSNGSDDWFDDGLDDIMCNMVLPNS